MNHTQTTVIFKAISKAQKKVFKIYFVSKLISTRLERQMRDQKWETDQPKFNFQDMCIQPKNIH